MAALQANHFSSLISLFMAMLFLSPLAIAINSPPLVISTCNQTEFKDVCISTLSSDSRSATADLYGLGRISTEKTAVKAKEALAYSFKAINYGQDYPQWAAISVCLHGFNDSVVPLEKTGLPALGRGDYEIAQGFIDEVKIAASNCANQSTDLKEMSDRSNLLLKVTSNTIFILNMLS
ncbi:pectinesterase inhibitor-like [Impatiens glandulifera]|uniref:pectinesterase inhibitor-like n=1 Tax=Impatiens glandulifera TaxID=253017 RepID=UPI001FB137A5|nr:pectinesterase inhibitor-like [Impatiens glandulifera]